MNREKMISLFEHYLENTDEHHKFDRIKNPVTKRPDLQAFMILDTLLPSDDDIIAAAEHDIIYLAPDIDDLAAVITEDDFLALIRCGISYDRHYDCLYMFV